MAVRAQWMMPSWRMKLPMRQRTKNLLQEWLAVAGNVQQTHLSSFIPLLGCSHNRQERWGNGGCALLWLQDPTRIMTKMLCNKSQHPITTRNALPDTEIHCGPECLVLFTRLHSTDLTSWRTFSLHNISSLLSSFTVIFFYQARVFSTFRFTSAWSSLISLGKFSLFSWFVLLQENYT